MDLLWDADGTGYLVTEDGLMSSSLHSRSPRRGSPKPFSTVQLIARAPGQDRRTQPPGLPGSLKPDFDKIVPWPCLAFSSPISSVRTTTTVGPLCWSRRLPCWGDARITGLKPTSS